jgi:hypothetical protein
MTRATMGFVLNVDFLLKRLAEPNP